MEEQVGVVTNEGRGGTEMNDPAGGGCDVPEEVDVCHDVVTEPLFVFCCFYEVKIVQPKSHLLEG